MIGEMASLPIHPAEEHKESISIKLFYTKTIEIKFITATGKEKQYAICVDK